MSQRARTPLQGETQLCWELCVEFWSFLKKKIGNAAAHSELHWPNVVRKCVVVCAYSCVSIIPTPPAQVLPRTRLCPYLTVWLQACDIITLWANTQLVLARSRTLKLSGTDGRRSLRCFLSSSPPPPAVLWHSGISLPLVTCSLYPKQVGAQWSLCCGLAL